MISHRVFRIATTVVVLLLSIGILVMGLALFFQAKAHCFYFVEPWFVGLGVGLSVLSLVGLFFLWKNYPSCYAIDMVIIGILALALLGVLINFWTLVAAPPHRVETWWMRRLLSEHRWSDVMQCMVRTDFCQRLPDFHACCAEPDGCAVVAAVVDPDCFIWAVEHHLLCYRCFSCRLATLYRSRDDGRSLQPALIVFICSLLVVIIASVVELYRRGIPLTRGGQI